MVLAPTRRLGVTRPAEGWYRKSLIFKEGLGDRPGMADTYHQLGTIAYLRGRLRDAEGPLPQKRNLAASREWRPAITCSGRLPRRSGCWRMLTTGTANPLAINEELGDRPHAAITYAQLALLAEDMGQGRKAMEWNIRCVTSIDQFPSVQTGTGATTLARLARQFGIPVLEETWQQVTGDPVPQ